MKSIFNALKNIRGAGTFVTRGSEPFVYPGISLPSGEELAFPLPKALAKAIIAEAEAAPYGMGEETVHDDSVRRCWQIDADDLSFQNPNWEKLIGSITRAAAKNLGIEGNPVAQPYKLLLYEKGGFFLPHRDTEKISGMFGSLIVNLPSAHTGGHLVVRHDKRGRTDRFQLRELARANSICCIFR